MTTRPVNVPVMINAKQLVTVVPTNKVSVLLSLLVHAPIAVALQDLMGLATVMPTANKKEIAVLISVVTVQRPVALVHALVDAQPVQQSPTLLPRPISPHPFLLCLQTCTPGGSPRPPLPSLPQHYLLMACFRQVIPAAHCSDPSVPSIRSVRCLLLL